MTNTPIYTGVEPIVAGIAYEFGLLSQFGNIPIALILIVSAVFLPIMWFFNKG